MKEKYGFVYIWHDKKHNRYYIGCRWGSEDDGYVCSSPWMKQGFKHRPNDFKRRILKRVYTNRQELLEEEYKWLSMIRKDELGKKYYNLHNHHFNHWTVDEKKSLTIREKLSRAQKKNFEDPEYKARFMETRKNLPPQTIETREKRRVSMLGKNVGRPKTEKFYESRKKLKGVCKPKITCKSCKAVGNPGNIARYHNDHCKYAGAV